MMDGEHQIVLEAVGDEDLAVVAKFLADCFSLPSPSAQRIAAAGPIAIVSGLEKRQADAIMAVLESRFPGGAVLRAADGGCKVNRLEWPNPPRIFGRPLAVFARPPVSAALFCPACGKSLSVIVRGEGDVTLEAERPASGGQPSNDSDPLFSGLKPLAGGAGESSAAKPEPHWDTGIWNVSRSDGFPPPDDPGGEGPPAGKYRSGLAAFMKPGPFAVVMGRTKDAQAVKMVAEILGIGEDLAREKCLSPGFCLTRNVSLGEAKNMQARLLVLGVKARIAKPA